MSSFHTEGCWQQEAVPRQTGSLQAFAVTKAPETGPGHPWLAGVTAIPH